MQLIYVRTIFVWGFISALANNFFYGHYQLRQCKVFTEQFEFPVCPNRWI